MSSTKRVIKNFSIYGLLTFLQRAIGFILLPLYTIYLTPNDYGITTVVAAISGVLVVFYSWALEGAITRFYYEYKDDTVKIKEFWGTVIIFVMGNSIVITGILFIFRNSVFSRLAKGIDFFPYLLMALISLTVSSIYKMYQTSLQAKQMGKVFAQNNLLNLFTRVGLTVLFVIGFKLQAFGVLLASVITDILLFGYAVAFFIPQVKFTFKLHYIKQALSYSLPLVPHLLSGWVLSMIDRLFVNNLKSTKDAGIYNIGFQFGNIVNILAMAVNQAYVPWFFEKMKQGEDGKKEVIQFANYAVLAYGYIAMTLSLFGKDILRIMVSEHFRIGWMIIPILSFAFVFNGIYYFFVNPLFYNKKGTRYIPVGTFLSAVLNIILNIYLVPGYGNMGASLATLISMFLASVFILILSQKIEKVNFNYIKMYMTAFFFFAVSLIAYLQFNIGDWIFFGYKFIVFTIVSAMMFIRYRKQISWILQLVKNKVKK